MRRPRKPPKPCPIPGCWNETPGGRPCNACRSWWGRVSLFTTTQLAQYLAKQDRFAGRARKLHSMGTTESRKLKLVK